jgi:hypothetical protein
VSHADPRAAVRFARTLAVALAVCSAFAASACGTTSAQDGARASSSADVVSTAPLAPAECATAVAATLGTVARRIYHEAVAGSIAGEAIHRVEHSSALSAAVESGDAPSARALLGQLMAGQIARIEILRSGHVFAAAGSGPAIAPVEGSLPGSGGARFILSVQTAGALLQVAKQVTGAEVQLRTGARSLGETIQAPKTLPSSGPVELGGVGYEAVSLPGSVYPSGALSIRLLVPSNDVSCPGPAAQTRVETLGGVGERIYREELESPYVKATVQRMQATSAFRSAVAAEDVAATRAAIVGFFAAHIHVVRVRVTVGSKLLIDLGGPHVLAPVNGMLRQGSKTIGHFTMAIQDDAGYLRLAHLFTGADILMRTSSGQADGTLDPGPAKIPTRGRVSYRGRDYAAYSFTGVAFPSGPLRISLLIGD